jgi:RNA polymerase sigma-70 factor (ECF subfamily)
MVVVVARRWGIGSMTPPLEQRPPADAPGEPADGALLSAGEAEIAGVPADPIAARAFVEVLFARYHAEIYAYLIRMLRDPELAADLAQDAFIRAYRAHASLDDPTKARAWLYQIANRVALDEIRRRKIVRFIPWSGESRGAAPSAERLAMDTRFSAELERALARIPERQRSALLLAEVHDLTGIELAAALGTSHVAARALLTRARESLRRAIAEERLRTADAEAAGRPLDQPAAGGTRLDGRR